MSTIQDITNRRSIRSFKAEQVSEQDLNVILEAGKMAPSSRNFQPWQFTVIQDKAFLDWIVEKNMEIVKASPELTQINPWINVPNYNNFYGAPTVILISGDKKNPWHVCDCALAMENMSLAGWAQEVGSVVVVSTRFAYGDQKFLDTVNLPEDYVPLYALCIGYIQGEVPPVPERKADCVNYVK